MSALTRRVAILLLVLLLAFAFFHFRRRIAFDWPALQHQLRCVSWKPLAAGVATIYSCYWLRAYRWAVLIRPLKRVSANALFPSQAIGFTAVALIGRVADFARPYLVARRFDLPVVGQLAVYSVERAFDLGAAAIVFSLTLAFAPATLPHHQIYARAGLVSFAATVGIVFFAVVLRLAGSGVASILRTLTNPLSKDLGNRVAARILDFREGLGTLSSPRQFVECLISSVLMWYGIASCYLLSARAFAAEPTLAAMSFTAIMLVFASSLGGSLLQLPILGWFTQIAINAAALRLLNVPLEAATACSTVMLIVLTLVILPAGLLAARMSGTSLRDAARPREAAAQRAEESTVS